MAFDVSLIKFGFHERKEREIIELNLHMAVWIRIMARMSGGGHFLLNYCYRCIKKRPIERKEAQFRWWQLCNLNLSTLVTATCDWGDWGQKLPPMEQGRPSQKKKLLAKSGLNAYE